jgi:midasin
MNKEQMIQSLKDLEFNINNGLVNEEDLKTKMEDLNIELDLLEDEIFDLSNKIQDDANYPTFFALYDEAEISNAQRELNIANTGLESTKLTIAQIEEYISHIKKEIEENNSKMQELNNENLAQGARLRELGITPNVEEEELIREVLNMNRNEISKLNAKNDRAREILAENEAHLVKLLESKSTFENKVNNAQINLNNAINNQANRPLVNEAARNIDKNELESKKIIKQSYEKQKAALSVNLSNEVNKIIADLQNDVISVDQVAGRLNELKANVSEDYFNADKEDRNNELVQNRKVQVELEEKINNLTAKVNNVNNYKYSDLELAREDEKVKILATKVQNSNSRIAELEKSRQQVENELAVQNKKVESREVENRIIALKAQLRKSKNEQEKNQIKIELDAAQKEAWNDLNDLTDVKAELENVNVSLSAEKNNLERYSRLHGNAILRKDAIDKKVKNNEVQNSYQKRLDEMELAKAKAALNSLNNRAKFISLPILDQLNNIIDGNINTQENYNNDVLTAFDNNEEAVFEGKNGEEIKVDAPLPFDENLGVENASFENDEKANQIFMNNGMTNDLEQNILNSLNNNEKLGGLKFKFEDNNNDKEDEENLNNAPLNNEEPVAEEEKEETAAVPLVGKMKAKFKTASNKLRAKAKDLEFRSKLKKWAKVIAVIAASAMLLVASGKLPQKTIDNLQDPKVIEQINNEELDPNELIEEDMKNEETFQEEVKQNQPENIENNNNINENKNNGNQNSGNQNNGNNNNDNQNNGNNNNGNQNNGDQNNENNNNDKDDHDNSDEITVPEENENNEQNQDDITIDEDTPVEELVPDAPIEENDDAIIEDEEKEEEFDNKDDIDDALIEDEKDPTIDDWDDQNQTGEEEVFDNEDQFGNIEDNTGNENQEEVFDNEDQFGNIEDNTGNENQEDVYDNYDDFSDNQNNNNEEENVFDNQDSNNESNNNSEEENVFDNSEDVQNNTTGVDVLEGETYLNDNMEEIYTNGGDVNSALDKDSNIHSIEQNVEEGKDVINVYTNEEAIQQQVEQAPAVEEVAPAVEEVAPAVEEVAPAVEEVAPAVEVGNETQAEQMSYNTSYEELSELDKLKLQREYYANMQNLEADSIENVSKSL